MPDLKTQLESQGVIIDEYRVAAGGSAYIHRGHVAPTATGLRAPKDVSLAIKEYKPTVLEIPGQRARIEQEATVGATLNHDHLVRTYDSIYFEENGAERAVLLLEWVDGVSLERWYADAPKPIPWDALQQFCLHLIDATAELHRNQILHRDIKPENVMVRHNPASAVLMDIGVAELTGDNPHTLHTAVKDFIGSARYASPQFILGEGFTKADDVYSLGATFVLLFTGHPIFPEVARRPVLSFAVLQPDIKKFAAPTPTVPPSMSLLLAACLHHDRKRRPTLDEFREAIASPDTSAFLTKELERQRDEASGFPIIRILDDGQACLADLSGDEPSIDSVYTVVRRATPLTVPSLQRKVTPEEWIAEVKLKHRHHNVGHFRRFYRRYVERTRQVPNPKFNAAMAIFSEFAPSSSTTGEWIEDGNEPLALAVGDIILKTS